MQIEFFYLKNVKGGIWIEMKKLVEENPAKKSPPWEIFIFNTSINQFGVILEIAL